MLTLQLCIDNTINKYKFFQFHLHVFIYQYLFIFFFISLISKDIRLWYFFIKQLKMFFIIHKVDLIKTFELGPFGNVALSRRQSETKSYDCLMDLFLLERIPRGGEMDTLPWEKYHLGGKKKTRQLGNWPCSELWPWSFARPPL